MVDETAFGTRDAKGHFVPDQRVGYGPLFDWPPKPVKIFKWFFGFPGYLFDRWFGTFHDEILGGDQRHAIQEVDRSGRGGGMRP